MHKLLLHPAAPGLLYQQNHVGVYRSENGGDSWQRIDRGLPHDYGFGLALNPHDAGQCFVVPLQPQEYSFRATAGNFRVYRREDSRWKALDRGLPKGPAYLGVLREGMSSDRLKPCGVYVGTSTGQLFYTRNEGESWHAMAEYLPPILSVSAAVV